MLIGFESVQFRKFPHADGGLLHLIDVAAATGFDWFALNVRLALLQQAQGGPSLAQVAAHSAAADLRVQVMQSLVIGAPTPGAPIDQLVYAVELFRPDVVSCNVFLEPSVSVVRQLRYAVGRLREVSEHVQIAIEFGRLWPVATLDDARDLVARIDLPGVGVNLDSWHFFHGPWSWPSLAQLPDELLILVQLSDHGRVSEPLEVEKDRRLLPGEGIMPLRRLVQVLEDKGYRSLVGAEVISEQLAYLPVEEFASRVYAATRSVLDRPASG